MPSNLKPIDRLLCLRPNNGPTDPPYCLHLAKRFFELETLWADKLDLLDYHPCIDIAEALAPGTSIPDVELLRKSTFAMSTAESKLCHAFLHWCNLKLLQPDLIARFALEDPYPILFSFFENGGDLSIEGWQADVFRCGSFNLRSLRQRVLRDGY